MRFVYSLVILALGLPLMVMARGRTVPTFRADRGQNLVKNISPNHPAYRDLARLNSATAALKESPACKARTVQCEAFGNRILGVFSVLSTASSSVGQNHIAGVIAGKGAEIVNKWELPAQEGAGVFLDGFVNTSSGSLSFRTNKGVESLLRHLGAEEALSGRQMHRSIRDKRAEIEENCRA